MNHLLRHGLCTRWLFTEGLRFKVIGLLDILHHKLFVLLAFEALLIGNFSGRYEFGEIIRRNAYGLPHLGCRSENAILEWLTQRLHGLHLRLLVACLRVLHVLNGARLLLLLLLTLVDRQFYCRISRVFKRFVAWFRVHYSHHFSIVFVLFGSGRNIDNYGCKVKTYPQTVETFEI